MQRPNVFIAQAQDRIDYSDAERFGALTFLTGFEWSPHVSNPRNATVLKDIRDGIRGKFDPNFDYLVLTGNPITMGAVFHYALLKAKLSNIHKLRILQWDRLKSAYREVIFDEEIRNG